MSDSSNLTEQVLELGRLRNIEMTLKTYNILMDIAVNYNNMNQVL